MNNVIYDKLFSVLKCPFGNVEAALRGVGATSFVFCNLRFRLDWQTKEFCGEVGDCLNFI